MSRFSLNVLSLSLLFLILPTSFLSVALSDSPSTLAECGLPSDLDLPPPDAQFVYRGEDVELDSMLPWMAFVMGPAICTATIVSPNFVLSAGHCVNAGGGKSYPPESVTIYAGSANLSTATPFAVEQIILRSEYADRYDDYIGSVTMADMALLKLAVPLNFTDTLRPICLSRDAAVSSTGAGLAKAGEVLVAGWGNTKRRYAKLGDLAHCETTAIWKLTHAKIPERLQYGRERILPMSECVDLELRWHLGQLAKQNVTSFKDHHSSVAGQLSLNERELRRRIASKLADKICVISDKDPHAVVESGDSGGPLLVSLGQGRWTQLGTLTGGPCHDKEAPLHDYYTQIDCEWIAIQTEEEVKCQ